ncbi:PAS domain S-box protein [Methanofollis fontis]|uniref:histidine kinase n=1 Tax=Methanofollis fontis TaxID=2052832 RepID=A0A483CLK0_9EURY|nr:PAS domain S-box protein [Methanofollis fontis]TAJ43344.1 hypothetical protein CUJ86_11375 [Methanofollis fontis]
MISLLCVDDEPEMLNIIRLLLEEDDAFTIDTAGTVAGALQMLAGGRYDAIVADYDMAESTGVLLLREIRAQGSTIPFILFTGKGHEKVAIEALNSGADFYVEKGGDPAAWLTDLSHKVRVAVERNRIMDALKEREEVFRAISETTAAMIWIHQNDRIRYANPAAERLIGYSTDQLAAMDMWDLVHPDDRNAMKAYAQGRVRGELPPSRSLMRVITAEGAERTLDISADTCIIEGEPAVIVTSTDITDLLLAKEALKSSEENYRLIFSSLIDVYFRITTMGMVEVASPSCERILGWKPEEIVSRDAGFLFFSEEEAQKILTEVLETSGVHDREMCFRTKGGRLITLSINARFVPEADGEGGHIEGTLRDITDRKQAEGALRKSEATLAATFETVHDGIIAIDAHGEVVTCNRKFREMWRLSGDELTEKAVREQIADLAIDPRAFQDYVGTRGKHPGGKCRGILTLKDRRVLEYRVGFHAGENDTGGQVWSFRDITQEWRAAESLREREEFFSTLMDALIDGALILDMDGIILYANNAACDLADIESVDEAIGRSVLDFVHPTSAQEVFRDVMKARGGRENYLAEYSVITTTGEERVVEAIGRTILYRGDRIIVVSIRDITQRKQAEEEAAEKDLLNRQLIEGLPEYIIVISTEGEIVFANPASGSALAPDGGDLTGMQISALVAPSSVESFKEQVKGAQDGATGKTIEIILYAYGNSPLPVMMRAAPIIYQNRDAVLLVFTDITERQIMEKELEYHAAELKRFSESLSHTNDKLRIMSSITRHDILNQLTVLLGYVEIAEEEAEAGPITDYLRLMKNAAENIREQIEFTRDYQDIGVGKPQWIDIQRTIIPLRAEGVTITSTIEGIEVYADPLFGKVFNNLLDNSIRHGGTVRQITVSWDQDDGYGRIIWQDDGRGVPDAQKEQIFKRGVGNHTGLGLFLSREICSITGMQIIETGTEGEGARFEIHVQRDGWRTTPAEAHEIADQGARQF